MARPARSEAEQLRGGMRAAALMNALAWRVGAENPHQFAKCFDQRTGMETQSSRKWRLNFSGDKPLSRQQLQFLSRFDADADRLYQVGPADLWQAMWGDVRDLWRLCRTRLTSCGPALDEQTWSAIADVAAVEKTFGEVLAEFEGELLLAEAYGEPLTLRHLTEAVVLYRLHRETNALIPLGIDGDGACRDVRLCLDDENVAAELRRLGILNGVRKELAGVIADPMASVPAIQRWDALASRLNWID